MKIKRLKVERIFMKEFKFNSLKSYDKEEGLGYFINALISARLDTGFRSNVFCMDEDVNVYLASLLSNFSSDEYTAGVSKYVCLYESDLIARQEVSYDLRERFNLYKNTADYLTVMIGIFKGINKNLPQYKSMIRLDNDVYISRARSYYAQAAEYSVKLKRGVNGTSEVLRKISENFMVYLNILYHMREKYFQFVEKFSDGEWFHFVHKNIIHRKGVNSKVYVELMDDFLARVSAWKKDRSPEDKDMIRIMCAELKRLNPEFHYNVETLFAAQNAVNVA
jgi:hypothetical protein